MAIEGIQQQTGLVDSSDHPQVEVHPGGGEHTGRIRELLRMHRQFWCKNGTFLG